MACVVIFAQILVDREAKEEAALSSKTFTDTNYPVSSSANDRV
jgi:hypothetical protein